MERGWTRVGLTGNQLKLIACIAMLADHIGYLLFPQVMWLRWVGRLALPIFAFFVAEGCRYTRNRRRYFGRMLGLGCLCQVVYVAEELLNGGTGYILRNILLTLAMAQLLCFAWLDFSAVLEAGSPDLYRAGFRFLLTVAAAVAVNWLGQVSAGLFAMEVEFDYGLAGMLLPLAALIGKKPLTRTVSFGIGLVLFCLVMAPGMPYTWYALCALPLLALYSGRRGSPRFQWAFYVFYPAHLAALYGIQFLL